ncbi:MAG: TIM44-like domain-containing protein [Myxococcota bacterium]
MNDWLQRPSARLWLHGRRLASNRWAGMLIATLAVVGIVALSFVWPEVAEARVGGGQNFSTGGGFSGGGGRSGSGGGAGGEGELLFLLIWLVFEHPTVGIPVLVVVVVVFVIRGMMSRGSTRVVTRTHHHDDESWSSSQTRRSGIPGLRKLREQDPGFSMPVLLDYLQLLHRRSTEAAVSRDWLALAPFLTPGAREDLETAHRGVTEVRDVVSGGVTVMRIEFDKDIARIQVAFQSTRRETLADGSHRHVYVEEGWTVARQVGIVSKAPEEVVRMGCPSCGVAIDTDRSGKCRSCGTPITDGLLQWKGVRAAVQTRRAVTPPQIGWTSGGAEPSVHVPNVIDPDLGTEWRNFRGRHPDFNGEAFKRKVEGIYLNLQTSWSAGDWDHARPFVTDTLYQTLRFYLEQYTEHGLRNVLTDVRLDRQDVVKVQLDAWYEAITVRIYGTLKDSVQDASGEVIGGNPNADRQFSEYWTFLRAIGSGDAIKDTTSCPSCGAPLDRVSQAGICGYCESKITSGRFDWVLSRIDQPAVYRG